MGKGLVPLSGFKRPDGERRIFSFPSFSVSFFLSQLGKLYFGAQVWGSIKCPAAFMPNCGFPIPPEDQWVHVKCIVYIIAPAMRRLCTCFACFLSQR